MTYERKTPIGLGIEPPDLRALCLAMSESNRAAIESLDTTMPTGGS